MLTRYMSYVNIDETDINWADAAEVTAYSEDVISAKFPLSYIDEYTMYVIMSIAIAPLVPRIATAAAGATRPAPCWEALSGSG